MAKDLKRLTTYTSLGCRDMKDKRTAFGFWIPDVQFTEEQKRMLRRLNLSDEVISLVESNLADLKAQYAANPPPPRQKREQIGKLHDALSDVLKVLDETHALSLQSVQAFGQPTSGLDIEGLSEAVRCYRDAAARARDGIQVVERGPDATDVTRVVLAVAEQLQEAGVPLNDSEKGTLVSATKVAFEFMGIHRADPRNNVRSALELIDCKAW